MLLTFGDAAEYSQRLPKKSTTGRSGSSRSLTSSRRAEGRTFPMFACIAVLRAMTHGQPRLAIPAVKRKKVKAHKIISQGRLGTECLK